MILSKEIILSQKTFRLLISAMSYPGKIFYLPQKEIKLIKSFIKQSCPISHITLFSIAFTLLDKEVTFCVSGKNKKFIESLIFDYTKCPITALEIADFVIFFDGISRGELLRLKRGTFEYPDKSSTAIFMVKTISLNINKGSHVTLKGPGIKEKISLYIDGASKEDFKYLNEINSEYPLGIDSIFIDREGNFICLPRTIKIEVK